MIGLAFRRERRDEHRGYFGLTTGKQSPRTGCCSDCCLVSAAVLTLVFGLMLLYLVRYRYNSPINRGDVRESSSDLK